MSFYEKHDRIFEFSDLETQAIDMRHDTLRK